ncbi:hypothetical protein KP005_17975 [Geomonas nitrogeniifigens]|uniref:NACHT-associated inactive Restriction Endonuclease 2 domain-containing protein n=1 Tax=Geomonas diazotrophica TaxID=2843197 RepID=A0ABX8JGS7_9BACT|nr:hypothetical protein [Geomonas nitrogeniifigens]QWV97206.1 hypothetical protein KP005_17975 [Geomonas nitrogeniifigens]
MLNGQVVKDVYESYGFETIQTKKDIVLAFLFRSGHYLNVDIVPLADDPYADKLKKELDEAGYASVIRHYDSLEEIDQNLFLGFFAADSSRKRLIHDYHKHTKTISEKLDIPYEYVTVPYEVIPTHSFDDPNFQATKPLVNFIVEILSYSGPTLILLEAAAGYGKTCTSYEVIKELINSTKNIIPILTELSRNRNAKEFRYVLLDEIDINFPSLNSRLVKEQIEKGRVPVIIDGFDELLRKSSNNDERFEDAEPMLDTISELLKNNAKVLLTTRRTAIFTDDNFYNWIANRTSQFKLYRIGIDSPTIVDWLGQDRVESLRGCNLPVHQISNPVLLAYLRTLDEKAFQTHCEQPELIVSKYVTRLLEREQERQNLKLSVEQQKQIFMRLANDMVKEDFTTETIDYIQLRILDSSEEILQSSIALYASKDRPTIEELALKLSGHALLDRRGPNDKKVGFVNDFIFGTLIGENILDEIGEDWLASELFLDMAVMAFTTRAQVERQMLWHNLKGMLELVDERRRLLTDIYLVNECCHNIEGKSFELLELNSCIFPSLSHTAKDTVFYNCVFQNVTLNIDRLLNVTFVNCKFYECNAEHTGKMPLIHFVACSAQPALDIPQSEEEESVNGLIQYESAVLERFWPRGKSHYIGRKDLRTLYLGVGRTHHKEISEAIESLKLKKIISVFNGYAELNKDMMQEVRSLLGRDI